MLKPHATWRTAVVVLALAALASVLAAAVRLAAGPIELGAAKPAAERLLAAQVKGGRASVDRAQFVWFPESGALGLRFTGVALDDGRGRRVLRARTLNAGVSLESLRLFTPALGELEAKDFFMAVTASPQGRYRLGYEAVGAPPRRGGLDRLIGDLTGRPSARRPASFLRRLSLTDGQLNFRHLGGRAAWRGHVRNVAFSKGLRTFTGRVDLSAVAEGETSTLAGESSGAVGLDDASLGARVVNLVPARLLPSAGATAMAARLDAPVNGRAALIYRAKTGMQDADIALDVGAGAIGLRQSAEALGGATLRARFDRTSQRIVLQGLRVDSARAALNLRGWGRLVPESRRTGAAHLVWALNSGPGRLSLARGHAPQTLSAFSAAGALRPDKERLDIDHISLGLKHGVVAGRGALIRARPGRSWGLTLDGASRGVVGFDEVLAFWPTALAPTARKFLVEGQANGRLPRASFAVRLPEGAIRKRRPLPDRAVWVDFAFSDAALRIRPSLPFIRTASGSAVLRGDRFDLKLDRGVIASAALSEGTVVLPRLKGEGKTVEATVRAVGPASGILGIVDGPAPHLTSRKGFTPDRLGGMADVKVTIVRPIGLGRPARIEDYEVRYDGVVRQASVRRAALGLTLEAPILKVSGTTERLDVSGPSRLGPYRGGLDFKSTFAFRRPMKSVVVLNGLLDAKGYGLTGGSPPAINIRAESSGGAGTAAVAGDVFQGKVDWTGQRASLEGRLNTVSLRRMGAPIAQAMPAQAPVRLTLARTANGWAGPLIADPYSGGVAWISGAAPRFRYVADLTPGEAARLGLSRDPAFSRPQRLSVDVTASKAAGRALYGLGPYDGTFEWSHRSDGAAAYRWKALLTEATLRALGLPAAIQPKGAIPIDVSLTRGRGGLSGTVLVAGSPLAVTSQRLAGGNRRVSLSGPVTADLLTRLGAPAMGLTGAGNLAAAFNMNGRSLSDGRFNIDLTRAGVRAPGGIWSKAPGRPFRLAIDLTRRPDGGYELGRIVGDGQTIDIDARGSWRPDGAVVLNARRLRLDTVFDGAFDYARDATGRRIMARARSIDARALLKNAGRPGSSGGGGYASPGPLRLNLDAGELRVTDKITVQQAHMSGTWGPAPAQRRMDISAKAHGGGAMTFSFYPEGGGTAISGKVDNVSDTAATFFDVVAFKGGTATVSGRLVEGGADLDIEMKNVRLIRAPVLAQVLTLASFKGMADTLNGGGIQFAEVVAPVRWRGSRVTLGHSRATGSALGVTTQGVIDLDRRTVDLSGAVAPAYTLNAMMGNVPVLGDLLVSRKGEGVFGISYAAKGPVAAPRITVNPLSLATPGILRRIFEGRSAAEPKEPAG